MEPITSLNNARVRQVQALRRGARHRARAGLFVIEGLRLVDEALAAMATLPEAYFTAEFAASAAGAALLARLEQADVARRLVSPAVMAAMSDTQTPQGILALAEIPRLPPPEGVPLLLIPDEVRDPGNLGTILRTAWAGGVTQVLLPPGTVDPTNPKVVRAGMGAHFHVPWRRASWESIREIVAGMPVWLAESAGGTPYDAVPWTQGTALIVGGEAEGAGSTARELAAGHHVVIPMARGVESLNVAIATAILLFEAARHRRRISANIVR